MAQPSVKITGGTGLDAVILSSNPTGSENALVVRMIPGSAAQPISGTVTSNQGTANTAANAWPYKLTDGTNNATVTAGGSLNVNITGGAASGSTTTDTTAFTATTSTDTVIGGFFQTVSTNFALGNGQSGAVQLTTNRAMHVNLRDSVGVALTSTSSALDINLKSGSIANTSFIATQSTPGVHGNYYWSRLSDGTNDVIVSGAGAIKVDGSAVTQPISGSVTVSGTVTANIGTTNGLALDATLTGGTAKFQLGNGTNYAALTNENSSYGLNVHVNNASPINVAITTAAATTTAGSLAALNAVLTATATNYDTALVTLKGTFTAVTVQFWASDDSGTTYYPVQAVRTDANLAGTSFALTDSSTTSYFVNVAGATTLQVKASAYGSGSVTARISPNGSSFTPTVVAGLAAGTNLVGGVTLVDAAGTNKASISVGGAIKVDGSAVTQPVSGTVAFSNTTVAVTQATASSLNATIVGVGTAGTASGGVLTVQGAASMTALKVDGSAVTQPVSGTVAVTGVATAANQTNGTALAQVSNGTNSAAVVNIAPAYNAYALVTRNIDSAANYLHIAATGVIAATNTKSGAGLLKAVVINNPGDTGATLTIYDNTSGIASIVAVIDLAVQPCTLTYGLALATGLSYAVAGITTSCDVTVLYA